MTATRADLADGAKRLADAFARAGRDARALKVRGSLEPRMGANGRPDLAATLAGAHELAAAGATDVQLGLLAFVRKPEQQDAFFAELRERWAAEASEELASMKILVMGGTQFNGLALVRELVRTGHDVSVCNRGKTAGRAAALRRAPDRRPHRSGAAARGARGPRLGLRVRHQRLSARGRAPDERAAARPHRALRVRKLDGDLCAERSPADHRRPPARHERAPERLRPQQDPLRGDPVARAPRARLPGHDRGVLDGVRSQQHHPRPRAAHVRAARARAARC